MTRNQASFVTSAPSYEPSATESGPVLKRGELMEPPTLLGRYALFGRIGAGGMGIVHLGRLLGSAGFERAVAIKRIHPNLANDHKFAAMFKDELRLMARVRHPNVISALDVVEEQQELLLIMEYVHGESLAALLQRATQEHIEIPVEIAATIACGVLKGLHAAHTATSPTGEPLGIIHRDISPHNVQVGCDGFARIVDFGVAKSAESRQMTEIGELRGKPGYVAPEQINGEPASHRSDIYALSVVLWEMLAGQRLFASKSLADTIQRVKSGDIPKLSAVTERELPGELEEVVLRGLSLEPSERYQTARDMAAAIESQVPLVSPELLGEWVTKTAGPALQERARQLSWAENCPVEGEQGFGKKDEEVKTLIQSIEPREEPTTREFPLDSLRPPGSQTPNTASLAPLTPPPEDKRRKALFGSAAVVTLLLGAKLILAPAGGDAEAIRAKAAIAAAQRASLGAPDVTPSATARPAAPAPTTAREPIFSPEQLPTVAQQRAAAAITTATPKQQRTITDTAAPPPPREQRAPSSPAQTSRKPAPKRPAAPVATHSKASSVDGF